MSSRSLSEASAYSSSSFIASHPPFPLCSASLSGGELSRDLRRGNHDSDDSPNEKRRASTDARRASHNAVERQRRDKLNARILELASLLPNLAGVRRPSRIAIAKSSIACINSSRRHRILASQQLQALYLESEAVREEVNQWRRREGVPAVVEPRRGDAFMLVLHGTELELDPGEAWNDEEFDEQYTDTAVFSPAPPMYQYSPSSYSYSQPQPQSAFAYGVSPPSSSLGPSSPYSSPPSSAPQFDVDVAYRAKCSPSCDPAGIVCPTPAHPFEAQHFIFKTENEWDMYAPTATHFHHEPPAW
ncbi:hypothetical protein K438DRAFT_242324 [Mycena galopus ATCC 62051]|nr:hypothetical protein K438DRAFT_242324 [Mycena galopus ATCC 62051]